VENERQLKEAVGPDLPKLEVRNVIKSMVPNMFQLPGVHPSLAQSRSP
jgi:hypothetical protein